MKSLLAYLTLGALVLSSLGLPSRAGAAGISHALAAQGSTLPRIDWADLGAKATAQYSGGGLSVNQSPSGAVQLRCAFQRLEGEATGEGLWLSSTVPGAASRFRVVAAGVGREGGTVTPLPPGGVASGGGATARFIRPGLMEEYSVSVDGVRQDFVVGVAPVGTGDLRVELAVSGARAETAEGGAQLVLDGSGRKLAYNRLHVVDAAGKELAARMLALAGDRLAVVVVDAGAVYPVRIDPTFSDASWSPLGTGVVFNYTGYGTVRALAVDASGNLYAGGGFTNAWGVAATNIVKWDGTSWSALGSGVRSGSSADRGGVHALAVVSGTNLYAAGKFVTAGGVSVANIAKWNGSAWSAVGSGAQDSVYALAVSGTNLYAGGWFSQAGGATDTSYIAKWNGSAWSALGAGGMDRYVYALAVDSSGNLYAGGAFTSAGGVAANRVAKWNGTAWSALGTGIATNGITGGLYTGVRALTVDGSNKLYAGGEFSSAGGLTNTAYLAKWNGSAWSAAGSGIGGVVQALAASGTNVYAGGSFSTAGGISATNIAQWDGTAWSALGSGLGGTIRDAAINGVNLPVNALLASGSSLYAGGGFTSAGGKTVAHAVMVVPVFAPPTTTTLASSLNPSILGDSVALTATVSPAAASGTVTFMDGATPFSTNALSGGTATFTTAALSGGLHNLTAVYGGEGTNYGGSISDPLSQTVIYGPAITTQPASQTIQGAGNGIYTTVSSSSTAYTNMLGTSAYRTASFSVAASSTSLAYQWYLGGTTLAGQTGSNLTVTASTTNAGDYTVVITNVAGAVTSSVATLTVDQPANSLAYAFDQAATGWSSTDWQATGNAYWSTDGGYPAMTKRMGVTSSVKNQNGSFWFKPAPINPGQSWKFYWTFQGGMANGGPADQCRLVIQADGTNAVWSYTGKFLSIQLDDYQNSGDPSASSLKVSYGTGASQSNFTYVNLATAFASANQAPGLSCVSSAANPPYNLSATYLAASNRLTVTLANTTLASGATGSTNNPLSYDYPINLASLFGTNAGVVGFNASTGGSAENHFILNASGLANFIAPVITSQPTNVVKNVGQSTAFTVTAVGATRYQWYLGGAAIAGATNGTYSIASIAMSQYGSYTVVASNQVGSVTSSAAILTSTTPYIAVQPASRVVSLGAATNLTFSGGGAGVTYQWFKDGVKLLGQTNSSVSFASFQITNCGSYQVVLSNSLGLLLSLPAGLSLPDAPFKAWGYNFFGQLGNGNPRDQKSPVQGTTNVLAVAGGGMPLAAAAGRWHGVVHGLEHFRPVGQRDTHRHQCDYSSGQQRGGGGGGWPAFPVYQE